MEICYRPTNIDDMEALFDILSRTRDNPIARERLAQMGVTPASLGEGLETRTLCGWVSVCDKGVIGFCIGNTETGEVLVLALLPDYEGRGIGKHLLGRVVEALFDKGHNSLWLKADSNSEVRAHGFYRYLGWRPTGQVSENGDERLELSRTSVLVAGKTSLVG